MKLSERDKKLLLILVVLAVIAIPYFFVISPFLEKNAELESQIGNLRSEVSYQQNLSLQAGDYTSAAEEYAAAKADVVSRFPSELLQEASILFIHNTEQIIPISLYQVDFGDDVAAQITSAAEEQAINEVEAATGDTTNDKVIEDNTATQALGMGLTGIQTQTRFAYDAGYEEFKSFLKYIMDYRERMVITDLEASYSAEMNLVNGNFTLAQYALMGEGRHVVSYLEPNMVQGTTNVFKQASGNFQAEEVYRPDFFILLNQPAADVDAIVVGRSNDVTEGTYLTSSKNALLEVNIYFTGENGDYNAYYEIGKNKYDEDGVDFSKEGSIELQILSSERLDDKDDVEINLNIVNETDRLVKVSVENEDEESPRVNLKGSTGDVIMN